MEFLNRNLDRILITMFTISMIAVFIVLVTKWDTQKQIAQAYQKGMNDAMNVEKPSERLEYVCAALWLKGQEHGNR